MAHVKLAGVHIPHYKDTADRPAVIMKDVKTVTVPTVMHIGTPASPVVKPGDTVSVGQLIAEPNSPFSAPIHAGISGTVKSIDSILQSNGTYCNAIVIESDGEMRTADSVTTPDVHDYESFIAAVKACGVVGLGGAGFPTSVKLDIKDPARLNEIVINGAECEPYITSDTRIMIDFVDTLKAGIESMHRYLKPDRVIIGIEKNKPECIKNMRKLSKELPWLEVKVLPPLYPQGHEKVLIYQTTGKTVPEGKLPIDAGVIVINCATVSKIGEFLKTGMPLVSKLITVSGPAVAEPKNVIAPIGTSMKDIFEFCGGFRKEPKKFLYGGPMMGISVPDINVPVLKSTNAILAFGDEDLVDPNETPCINCGRCVRHCPMKLEPTEIEKAYRKKDFEKLEALKISLCMECGCCSYICPANRKLTQYNKLAKAELRSHLNAKKKESTK